MTIIRNRNRILRLAGVMLLTAAIALIPVAAFADSHDSDPALLAPTAPTNLEGRFVQEAGANFVQLNWQDSQETINPLCHTVPFIAICLYAAVTGANQAELDAPTSYVVENQQPRQTNSRGYWINGQHDWTEIATLTGSDDSLPAMGHRDTQQGAPSRILDYRVKACNAQGCSAWSATASVRVEWDWCQYNRRLCD